MAKKTSKKIASSVPDHACCDHDALMNMLESTNSAVCVVDGEGRVVFMNRAMDSVLGCKAGEVKTLEQWAGLCLPDPKFKQSAIELWEGDIRGRKLPPEREMMIRHKDGSERWCRLCLRKMKNDCVVISGHDITDARKFRISLLQHQFAIDHASDAVYWIGPDAKFIYVNNKACDALGYSRKEFLSMTVHDIDPKFTGKMWPKHWEELRKRGSFIIESVHKRKDGTTFPVEISINYLKFEGREYNYAFARDLSERERARRMIKESELSFRDLANATSEAILIYEGGRLINANDRFCRIFGYTRREIKGSDILSLVVVPREKGRLMSHIKQAGARPWESIGMRKDGTEFPIEVRIRDLQYGGRKVNVLAILDITERKQTEAILEDSESRFRSIVESAPMGMHMYRLDDENRLIFIGANPAADSILGIDHRQMLNMPIEEVFPPLVNTDVPARYREIALTGKPWHTEQIQYQDHRISGVFEVHAFRTSPRVMVASFIDITQRRQDELAMRQLAAAVDSAAESIVITDLEGDVIYVNPWFHQMTGYSREEVMGRNTRIFASGRHDQAFYKDMWATILDGRTWRGHFINKKKDGTLFEEDAVISPVIGVDGAITNFVAVKRDITQQMLLEKQIVQSQKMAAIGQLAHRVAHNFTNMLVVILGNSQLAKAMVPKNSEAMKYMDDTIQAANRVSILTSELLSFAHPADIKLKVMPLKKALIGVEALLKETVDPMMKVSVDISNADQMVCVDPVQLEQALVHMAINADEAMPPTGGSFLIKAGASDYSAGFAMITVEDTGMGMSEEMKQTAFEPFSTTKNNLRNQGLGLAAAYRVITQQGGLITVDSTVGKGTKFKIYIPLAPEK